LPVQKPNYVFLIVWDLPVLGLAGLSDQMGRGLRVVGVPNHSSGGGIAEWLPQSPADYLSVQLQDRFGPVCSGRLL